MTTVIHTADTHLGYKQYHETERVQDFSDAFTQLIDKTIAENVDAVVHAGDLFHDSRPNTTTILTAIQQLRRLKAHDIPFLMVIGNHEDTHENQWADIFEEMNLGIRLGTKPVTIGNTDFYGIDYVPTTRRAQLDYQFPDHNSEYAALVAHGGFQPLSMHDDWNAEHVLGKSNISFDAFLLGDDHTPKTETINGTLTTYPGSTERTAHDQRAERIYNKVTFGGFTNGVQLDTIPLKTRDFYYIDELELDENDTPRIIRDEIDNTDVTDSVVIVTVDGDGEPFTTAELEEYILDAGALVARVRDGRSLETEDVDFEVSFADPDDAVEQRIRDLDLSVVGHSLDNKVRDLDGIPDSNLSEEIKEQMDERVDENPDEFTTEPALDPLPDDTTDNTTDNNTPPDNTTDTTDDTNTNTETPDSDTDTETESNTHQANQEQIEDETVELDASDTTPVQTSTTTGQQSNTNDTDTPVDSNQTTDTTDTTETETNTDTKLTDF